VGSSRVQNRNFSSLLPAAKIFSYIDWGKSPFSLELVDLSRRKVTYQQDGGRGLNWLEAAAALEDVKPGMIDVKSLQNRWYSAQFFLDEVARLTRPGKQQNVLIVLSGTVEFEGGQETKPLVADPASHTTVFYIRYQPYVFTGRGRGRGPGRMGYPPLASSMAPIDQLAGLLKPLEPHLYDAATPEQFRKVLASVLAEIAKL